MGFLKDIKNRIKGVEKKEEINFMLSKKEKLIILFKDEDKLDIETVLMSTGIQSAAALRTYIWELKKSKELFLYQKFGYVYKGKK